MNSKQVLIVDDEVEVTSFFSYFLKHKRCQVTTAHSGADVKRLIAEGSFAFDLAFVDLKLPDANGLDLLQAIKHVRPDCDVIIMTGYSTIKTAVTAMQRGARDYLEKPFDNLEALERIVLPILDEPTEPADDLSQIAAHYGIIYAPNSPMARFMPLAAKLAKKAINVLIEGETGTGKELLARFIHGESVRSQHPFVGLNCGALPQTLLESELFGHEKGSFTGALKERRGFFELAHNGTLFLDEIGEAPLMIQVKLLRVMETGEFNRIGGEETRKSNIRFISATNRNLEAEVERKRFRSDLLYRLEGVKLTLPPLRERPADIAVIVADYLEKKFAGTSRLGSDALALLQRYEWPGNVRQLLNVINQSVAIHECPVLSAEHLPSFLHSHTVAALDSRLLQTAFPPSSTPSPVSVRPLTDIVDQEAEQFVRSIIGHVDSVENLPFDELMERVKQLEREVGRGIIEKGLAETRGNRELLSRKLNITKRTIRYILNEK
ncbi:sigma-54-dependent Fis family transcriptional regulator [Brevibacillus fluminis]|uniref:Sigma-54-dependent Fis family transcriptional regulator n=1 Tax=Brevibacillus fluminis TaxID=511487 RepID=A0A3M8DS18_9BACL|nr:sigma-54 dependent transcriptional regulator [Brevibacillus fluminis]RNB90251.1 sigma-54-dependent Fis family transcriptional regulator [Brevibacillus fluminis]